jgi:hypothetical protein
MMRGKRRSRGREKEERAGSLLYRRGRRLVSS